MQPSSRLRSAARLSDPVHRRLSMYALAASAAGVGMLALAQPAEGEIIYTPANKILPNCAANPKLCLKLDLNHDGIVDFRISFNSHIKPYWTNPGGLWVENPLSRMKTARIPKNAIWGTVTAHGRAASALSSGVSVGTNTVKFSPANNLMFAYCFSCGQGTQTGSKTNPWGPWAYVQDRYLGLQFYIKGETHFGWARLNASLRQTTLTGYAYESIPNKPIVTGQTRDSDNAQFQPASLGRLAQGSAGRPGK